MNDFDRISPVSLDVVPLTLTSPDKTKKSLWLKLLLITSLCIIGAFLFWVVTPHDDPEITNSSSHSSSPVNKIATFDNSKQSSPWQEAQWAKQRRVSQQTLGQLLDKQQLLEQIGVSTWANSEYQQALTLAQTGDEHYRNKDYERATHLYKQGAKSLQQLLENSDSVFTNALEKAKNSLNNNDAIAAENNFLLALTIKPDDETSKNGLRRSKLLDQILQLKSQGTALQQNNKLEEALASYQQALSLDPETTIVNTLLLETVAAINERDFNNAMAKGYLSLQNNKFENAKQHFINAKNHKNSDDKIQQVNSALEVTANQQMLYRIAQQKNAAQRHVTDERWQLASDAYRAILAIDPNLDFAKDGLAYSKQHHFLETEINKTIRRPDRMAEDSVYKQALVLYKMAKSSPATGPKLAAQTSALEKLLKQALIPIKVILESDDLTDVTLYQITHIGNFKQHVVNLKPGRYTIVGSRDGYKDVRREFSVVANESVDVINIQCSEKIL